MKKRMFLLKQLAKIVESELEYTIRLVVGTDDGQRGWEVFLTTDWERIENSLNRVAKPGRYTGGEFNSTVRNWNDVELKVALAFPDVYEIGISHLGLRILYEIINNEPEMLAERVYAPWIDFQELLREKSACLYTLENKRALRDFDVIGFSLQYELGYTNILTMLELGGVPLLREERERDMPLVIAGGPCAFNPEPMADFFDFFVIGEAEEILLPVLKAVREWKQSGDSKEDLFIELEKIEGVYVPSHFQVSYMPDGRIKEIESQTGAKPVRAVVRRFEQAYFPKRWIVPFLDIVHDRITYEIQRGCTKGCRFCQAGMIYRPVREREPGAIFDELRRLVADTGYEELSLTSLSSADYSQIEKLITDACGCFTPQKVNVSLPSLRVDSFSVGLAKKFQSSRKGSLTFAPEAGTDRMRRVINKGVSREDLLTAAEAAFKAGWQKLKLYFMIGLPTETEEDLAGIVELVNAVLEIGKKVCSRGNALRITASVSTFVPKAHTPFQWQGQISIAKTIAKQSFLQERIRGRFLELDWHKAETSFLEGIMARGDRRLSKIILQAWQKGAQFDGWSDQFKAGLWWESFREHGIEPSFYTRRRSYDEVLSWSHLNTGLTADFLKNENEKAEKAELTPDCRKLSCTDCGVCTGLKVAKRIAGGPGA